MRVIFIVKPGAMRSRSQLVSRIRELDSKIMTEMQTAREMRASLPPTKSEIVQWVYVDELIRSRNNLVEVVNHMQHEELVSQEMEARRRELTVREYDV